MNLWSKLSPSKSPFRSRPPVRSCAAECLEDRIAPATLVGLTTIDTLVTFDSAAPTKILSSVKITGLDPGENIVSIDARPASGGLYGLTNTNRLYTLSPFSGAATEITSVPAFLLGGKNIGIDFNPTVDRVRVVNDNDLNFRINPNNGAIVDGQAPTGTQPDSGLEYAAGDPHFGKFPTVTDVAYDRNFQGATLTTLFGIDATFNTLVRIGSVDGTPNSPNGGAVTTIGALGVNPAPNLGFDIAADGTAYAALKAGATSLFTIDLVTGHATLVGKIGKGSLKFDGLTVLPHEEIVTAVTATNKLVTFRASDPGVLLSSVPLTGLAGGETIAGIDFRPSTGELIAITNQNHIFSIDRRTGQTIARGLTIDGAAFAASGNAGFDFNPTVDRVRLVNTGDDNLRYNPVTFAPVDTNTGTVALDADTDLSFIGTDPNFGSNPNITGVAYDRNDNNGATATTLFGIDSTLNILVRQGAVDGNAADVVGGGSPNGGLLNTLGALGVDPTDQVGFDISNAGANGVGVALAVMQLQGEPVSKLFAINIQAALTNQALGTATPIGTVGDGEVIAAMAIAPASVQFAATNAVVKEKAGTFAVIEITRTGGADIAASVIFDTADGTATAGLDYTALTNELVSFAPGQTIKRVMIPILGDRVAEFDETIGLRLSKAGDTSTNVLGDTINALITIRGKALVL